MPSPVMCERCGRTTAEPPPEPVLPNAEELCASCRASLSLIDQELRELVRRRGGARK